MLLLDVVQPDVGQGSCDEAEKEIRTLGKEFHFYKTTGPLFLMYIVQNILAKTVYVCFIKTK